MEQKRPNVLSHLLVPVLLGLAFCGIGHAQIDRNLNAMSDVWEQIYGAESLTRNGDEDGDGHTNAEEERMGTNPFDPNSRLHVDIEKLGADSARLTWDTVQGKTYRSQRLGGGRKGRDQRR